MKAYIERDGELFPLHPLPGKDITFRTPGIEAQEIAAALADYRKDGHSRYLWGPNNGE